MNETATPDTGAEPTGTPEAPVTEESVINRISDFLSDEPQAAPEPEAPEPTEEDTPQEEPQSEEEAAPDAEAAEPEPTIEDVLPDNLQALAEEIGLEADELAQYLKVPVKVNGETTAVPLEEAIKGYQREAVFTQKSQELAEQRRVHEAQVQQATQHLASQIDQINQLATVLQAEMGQATEADLLQVLEEEGSEAYLKAKADAESKQQRLLQAQQTIAAHYQQTEQQTEADLAKYRNDQVNALKEAMPELADQKHQEQFVKELMPYLQEVGFTEPELQQMAQVFDHRLLVMARDGMKYQALQKGKSKAKKLQNLPKVTKPGQARKRTTGDDLTSARNRLKSLKGRTRQQQDKAAIDFVKQIL